MKTRSRINMLHSSLMLLAVMVLIFVPFKVLAEDSGINVYMTVSNKGVLEKTKDGSAMVLKKVTVTDIDKDGKMSYDEALAAAHKAYDKDGAAGYTTSKSEYGASVIKIWGEDTYNTLFYNNGEGLVTSVDGVYVKEGDKLYVSLNKEEHSGDWYSVFDASDKTVKAGEKITLNLKGRRGMAWTDEEKVLNNLKGMKVGVWTGSAFNDKDVLGKTDDKGNVTISFAEPGMYIVTAEGTLKDTITVDWTTMEQQEIDCPIMAPYSVIRVEAPVSKAAVTIPAKTYTGKALTPAVTVKYNGKALVKDKDYTVKYSNNKKAGKSAKATITGKGFYTGSVTKTFTINKAKQPMKVKVRNKTFKAKVLKKKKLTYKAVTVSKNAGKVSYKVKYGNKKAKKALKFSKGKITVRKKTRKGTYKVTVTITAKGNANYRKGSTKKTIKVKVK